MKYVSVVSVPVSDQQRAKDFYLDKLGFDLLVDSGFGDGMRWIQLGIPGAGTTLALVNWFDEMPPGSLRGLVIDCADLEAEYRTLSERGVSFTGPPSAMTGGTFAILSDPDGNRISLRQADAG